MELFLTVVKVYLAWTLAAMIIPLCLLAVFALGLGCYAIYYTVSKRLGK